MPDVNVEHPTITPAEARTALARLAKRSPLAEARRADAEAVRAAIAAWRYAIDRWHRFGFCPACGEWISTLYAAEHVAVCYLAPAVARATRAEAELRVLSKLGPALGLEVPDVPKAPGSPAIPKFTWKRPPDDGLFRIWIVFEHEARNAIDLLEGICVGASGDKAFDAVVLLEHVLSEWAVYHARARSRCDWCASEHELTEYAEHLLHCERHPEHERAAWMEEALLTLRGPVDTGVGAIVAARDRFREALGRLLVACNTLDDRMGWDDGRIKLRTGDAEPWNEARKAARSVHSAG